MEQFPDDYECEGQIDIWEWMEEKESQSMTREELIRYGKDYLNDLENACCDISDKHMEFVRQSIKALSAEPCCNCIEFKRYAKEMGFEIEQEPTVQDKQAESEKYQKAFDDGYDNGYAQARFDFEPKTGHWVSKHIVDDCNGVVTWYECSECGRSIDETITEEFMLKDYPYCHCGAKMVVPQKRSE